MGRPRTGKTLKCKRCGAEFYRKPSGVGTATYCSRDCQYQAFIKGKPRRCRQCGEMYYKPPSQVRLRGSSYCSNACDQAARSARQLGDGNRKYQGNRIKVTRLDAYFSLFIRARDGFTCQRCQHEFVEGTQGLDNSHYIGRTNKRTRFDEENCDALCRGCHQFMETHKVTLYRDWKIEQLGEAGHQALLDRSRIALKVGSAEWDEMCERVRARCREMNGRLSGRAGYEDLRKLSVKTKVTA